MKKSLRTNIFTLFSRHESSGKNIIEQLNNVFKTRKKCIIVIHNSCSQITWTASNGAFSRPCASIITEQ